MITAEIEKFFQLNLIESKLYLLEQKIYSVLYIELNYPKPILFLSLLFAGLLTSLSPCLLSIIPASLSYIWGEKVGGQNKNAFLLGILGSSNAVILFTHMLNEQCSKLLHIFPLLSAIAAIYVSLNLMQIFNFSNKFSALKKFFGKPLLKLSRLGIVDCFAGILLGAGSIPCSIYVILIVSTWISSCEHLLLGLSYIGTYLAGYTLSLYLLINLSCYFKAKLAKTMQAWESITLLSGSSMLAVSTFSLLKIMAK